MGRAPLPDGVHGLRGPSRHRSGVGHGGQQIRRAQRVASLVEREVHPVDDGRLDLGAAEPSLVATKAGRSQAAGSRGR